MNTLAAARNLIDSHADWWALAGLHAAVGDAPVAWLAPNDVAAQLPKIDRHGELGRVPDVPKALPQDPLAARMAAPAEPLAPLAIPADWDEFQAWLANDPAVPGTQWQQKRILPRGPQAADVMLLSLCPELGDQEAGELHSGAAGRLVDAMLRAIGLTRAHCYVASLAMTRPPGGRLEDGDLAALLPLLWHHIRVTKPQRLLIFGNDLSRRLARIDVGTARGKLLDINQDGVKVEAVATQHPQLLLNQPKRKAAAWDSIKCLARGVAIR